MNRNNILITSAGRRVSLVKAFQKELKILKIDGNVFCTDLCPELSSACLISNGFFKVKRVTDENYIRELLEISVKNNIKIIIPTIDTELEILASNADIFKQKAIEVVVSDELFIDKCRDKRKIHDFFDELGFPRAKDISLDNLTFPLFVKPYDGSRSVGIFVLNNRKELTEDVLSNSKNMFLEYINPDFYDEFTIDLYLNKASNIISIVPRERLFVRDGEVNKACTRKNEIISFVKEKFGKIKGMKGCITLQVFKHKEKNKIIGIEINPRFGGGYPLSYEAGANFPNWIIQEYILGVKVESYLEDWKEDTLMLRYDAEVISYGYKGK